MGFKFGIDRLGEFRDIFAGKRIGLMTNQTGITSRYVSTIDALYRQYNLVKLFAPEHGVRGNLQAGVTLEDYRDPATNLPVISLYGTNRAPQAADLADIDVFAIDIQDVGARFYTYLYTMSNIMEACAKAGITCVVFDRPNPLGSTIEGNILDTACQSFIGKFPIPQRYGLTIGECAMLFNHRFDIHCKLVVVPMGDYIPSQGYKQANMPWIAPSPNIPTAHTCFAYNATCLFEGTNVSEGRGTTQPFSVVGAPWLAGETLAKVLNALDLPGVYFRPHYFTPMTYHPTSGKYQGQLCGGVELMIHSPQIFQPVATGFAMLYIIRDIAPHDFEFSPPYTPGGKHMIDYNTGNAFIRTGELSLAEIAYILQQDREIFHSQRQDYLMYPVAR